MKFILNSPVFWMVAYAINLFGVINNLHRGNCGFVIFFTFTCVASLITLFVKVHNKGKKDG